MEIFKEIWAKLLEKTVEKTVTPELIQNLLVKFFNELESITRKTSTPIDDGVVLVLKSILTTRAKSEWIADWILDKTVPRRCGETDPAKEWYEQSISDPLHLKLGEGVELKEPLKYAAAAEIEDVFLDPLIEKFGGQNETSADV